MSALVFNALSGPELKAFILSEIEKKLDATGEFVPHVTFPWVKCTFKVELVVYPKQAVDDKPGITAEGSWNQNDPIAPQAEGNPATITVEGEKVIDTPDIARLDAGLPLPTVAPVAGVLIDKPVFPPAPEAKPTQRRGGAMGLKKAETASERT